MDTQNKKIDETVRKYWPKVKKFVAIKLPDHSSIHDDLVQDVMWVFISQVQSGKFSDWANLNAYLLRITRNKIGDYLKYKGVRKGQIALENKKALYKLRFDQIESDDKIDQKIEIQEMVKLVKRKVELMKPKYREIIYLHYYEELPMHEVAKKLGISAAVAYTRKIRALRMLIDQCKQALM